MRVMWFPAGRDLWFDLAVELQAAAGINIVFWMGDDRHLSKAKSAFPDAHIFELDTVRNRDWKVPHVARSTSGKQDIWQGEAFYQMRDIATKLMDRDDKLQKFSPLEREAYFHQLVHFALSEIDILRPDFVFFAEAPHTAVSYIFQSVAKFTGVKILHCVSWPMFPGLEIRQDIDGLPLQVARDLPGRDEFLKNITAEIETYLGRFSNQGYGFEPQYMQVQAGRARYSEKWYKSPRAKKVASVVKLLSRRYRRRAKQRTALRKAQSEGPTQVPTGPFVYFPLHYEPERTTTPDGGAFRDQLQALAILRCFVPREIEIVVKEHPSTFNAHMLGHAGRTPRHYEAIRSLEGVTLVSGKCSADRLLRECQAVASISGTAAVEAAILGKPALHFGNAWYEGLPNTHRYSGELTWADITVPSSRARDEICRWLVWRATTSVISGTVNPSNEKAFSTWYMGSTFRAQERQNLLVLLTQVLKRPSTNYEKA